VKLYSELDGGNKVGYAASKSLSNLGIVLLQSGDPKAALPHFKAALKAVEETFCSKGSKSGKKMCAHSDVASAYNMVGVCLEKMGSFSRAQDFFKKSDAVTERTGRRAPWQ